MKLSGFIVRFLGLLLIAVVSATAYPAERVRERVERKVEPIRDHESLRERRTNVESLPPEFQRSWLYQHEIRDSRTREERGVTLRKYVAERPTREAIREQMLVRERMAESNLAMYVDVQTAERATAKTIRENRAEIEAWKRSDGSKPLELRYQHEGDVGLVMVRDGNGREQALEGSRTSVVKLVADGKGGYYIAESFPARESVSGSKGPLDRANGTRSTDAAKEARSAEATGESRVRAEPVYRTTKEAQAAAEALGFVRVNERIDGEAVFRRGKREFISRDRDGHNGGAWKMADSVKDLGSKETRRGTFDVNLNRIGD